MFVRKYDEVFVIRIYKEYLGDIDFFDKDEIKELFHDVLINILDKYELNGLLDVDIYINDKFGAIIEIRESEVYFGEIDMNIQVHINSVFLSEIVFNGNFESDEVYYYKDKFYCVYDKIIDSSIIYKDCDEIIEKGIRIF